MTNARGATARDRKVILSTLWIFAVLNYIYADVFTLFFDREAVREIETGTVDGIQITQGFALMWAIILETAIVMPLLSRVLPYAINRWVNVVVAALHTAAVAWSLTGGAQPFYVMFATVEIACTLFIVWYAITWRNPARAATPATGVRESVQTR